MAKVGAGQSGSPVPVLWEAVCSQDERPGHWPTKAVGKDDMEL